MNPTIKCKIAYGVASIMKYVHQNGIVHSGLKIDGILFDENFEPVISDFEHAIFLDKHVNFYEDRALGAVYHQAPEIFNNFEEFTYSFACDVYSYAFILLKLFTNIIKLDCKKPPKTPQSYRFLISEGYRPTRPENIPDSYWELIKMCWKDDPHDRPTFAYIVEELKKDKYVIEEYGMKTNLDELKKYQKRIDLCVITDSSILNKEIAKMQAEYDQQNQQIKKPISLSKEESKQEICIINEEDEKFIQSCFICKLKNCRKKR